MATDRLLPLLSDHVAGLHRAGTAKGSEAVVVGVVPAGNGRGPRLKLKGEGEREFLRLNSNSYLGLGLHPEVIRAEEEATQAFGVGPGAVRFISGSYRPHLALEAELADFHQREDAVIFSSAYAAVISTITPLTTPDTVLISDALNHNCIINAMKLARPAGKAIYGHNDVDALDRALRAWKGRATRALVVTDGVFSMRGDHAPLREISDIVAEHDPYFPENVVLVVDDSHGVGAFGPSGRGTEEHTGAPPSDVLVGTLGKAFGVNGGYVACPSRMATFFRESSQMYIYSNPITAGEAAAARKAVRIVDSPEGQALIARLRSLTKRFDEGLRTIGVETIPGDHPVVPLMIRDTARTNALVEHLFGSGILVTGLTYPVVPRGDEEIRTQVNADHTESDIDLALDAVQAFGGWNT